MTPRISCRGWSSIAALALCLLLSGMPSPAGSAAGLARDPGNLTGKLLVATPSMDDPNFTKTVIFIVEHDEHGALGIVLNRVLGAAPAADVLKGLGIRSDGASGQIKVFLGGPVSPEAAFILHSTDYANPDTRKITNGIAVTGDAEILEAISRGKGPRKSLLSLGYAGWGPGQLESEIAHEAWYVAPADPSIVFGDDIDGKWRQALATSGVDL